MWRVLKGYHIDWSVIPVYIERVHLWPHNKRAKRSGFFYACVNLSKYFANGVCMIALLFRAGQSRIMGRRISLDDRKMASDVDCLTC